MKVKVFRMTRQFSGAMLETEISEWISQVNPKIINVLQSESSALSESSHVYTFTITFLYTSNNEK